MRTIKSLLVLVAFLAVAAAPVFAQYTQKQTPPIELGTSGGSLNDISRLYCCGGTLGAAVYDNGVLSILSNNHILARSGLAKAGEDTIQPALIDNNCSGTGVNVVGDFIGDIVRLGTGNVDAAISTARAGMVNTTGEILGIGVPCNATQMAAPGLAVHKSGRTTGHTSGTVQAINLSVRVSYQKGCGTGRIFYVNYTNQISITPGTFSSGGDSGSLIVSDDGTPHPVGLLFAGSSSVTVANRIQDVVSAFAAKGHTLTWPGNTCAAAMTTEGAGSGPSENDVDFATVVKERHEPDLFAHRGVIGVGVGADDADPTQAVIVVYLETPAGAKVRPHGLPADLDGVKVKVIPTEPFVAGYAEGSCGE